MTKYISLVMIWLNINILKDNIIWINWLFLGDRKAFELPTCAPVSTAGDVISLTVNAVQDKVKN